MNKKKPAKREIELAQASELAFSVKRFCELHSLKRSSFYKMIEDGTAPKTFKAGGRRLISVEAAAEWRKHREAEEARR